MKRTTVTVGIPAFNEEHNIENMLHSLTQQKLRKSVLKKIIVYSDNSTDRTNEIVARFAKKHSTLTLIHGKTNKGKYFRVNQLFALCKTDVLVILDADLALVGSSFLENLTQALVADSKALMMAAHIDLIRAESFVAKLLHTSFTFWDYTRLSVPNYDTSENFHGAATAYKKSFIKTVHIPTNLSDPHLYIYLSAKVHNGFRYCRQAKVLQYPPTTVQDMKRLLNRSIGKRDVKLEKIFGKELIDSVHYIPRRYKIKAMWQCFLKYPFYTPLALALSFYLGRLKPDPKKLSSPIWEITTSTKRPIVYAK